LNGGFVKKLVLGAVLALCTSQLFAGDIVYEGDLGTLSSGFGTINGAGADSCGICGHGDGALTLDFWEFTLTSHQFVTITGTRFDENLDLVFGLFAGHTNANYADRNGVHLYYGVPESSVLGLIILYTADDENGHPSGPYGDPTFSGWLDAGTYTVIVSAGIGSGPDPAHDYLIAFNSSGTESLVETPEPTSVALASMGMAGLALWARRRRQRVF
jgi:hypothetical protein